MHGQAQESFHKVKLRQNVVFILPETALEIKKPKVCVGVDCLQAFPPSPSPSSAHNVRSPPYLLFTYISNIDIGIKKP